jgi:plastocyanin domain-containing protein
MRQSKLMIGVLAATAIAIATAYATGSHAAGKIQPAQVIPISVTSEGFVPAEVKAKAGQPVKLVVTRKVERTCATEIVIKDFKINKPLPLNQAVEVELTPVKPGKVRFACGMDMIAGTILVE